jgi:peptidoglycan/xylan/chitin deacetylase (PgdA/CDA1 family)
MTWSQIKELQQRGFLFGAHTIDHYCINNDNIKELEHQIGDCRRMIEEKLGVPCEYFAFPYGRLEHANPKSNAIVEVGRFKLLTNRAESEGNLSPYEKLAAITAPTPSRLQFCAAARHKSKSSFSVVREYLKPVASTVAGPAKRALSTTLSPTTDTISSILGIRSLFLDFTIKPAMTKTLKGIILKLGFKFITRAEKLRGLRQPARTISKLSFKAL